VCRVRPVSQREIEANGTVCVEFPDQKTITLKTSQVKELKNIINTSVCGYWPRNP